MLYDFQSIKMKPFLSVKFIFLYFCDQFCSALLFSGNRFPVNIMFQPRQKHMCDLVKYVLRAMTLKKPYNVQMIKLRL